MTRLPKLPSTVSEIFEGEKLSHQKKIFHQFVSLSWWFTGLGKELRSFIKAAFYVFGVTFCLKTVLEKMFNSFAVSAENFSQFWREIVELVVKHSFYVFTRKFCGKKNWRKKLFQIIFWLWERNFQTFTQKFLAELSKQHSAYPEDESQARKCFWKYTILHFPLLRAELFGL